MKILLKIIIFLITVTYFFISNKTIYVLTLKYYSLFRYISDDRESLIKLNKYFINYRIEKKKAFDIIEWLFEIGRGWFNIIPYCCRYINLNNYIVFNHNNNKFKSLINTYSNYTKKFIKTYNEDKKPIILKKYKFKIRIKIFNTIIFPIYFIF
ncbi:MAG: hypothetical protein K0R54_2571 [Clostridiaceae bacterium]|jgi:flagellar biosynthesis/type III secretory pathway chaperone|nr:hypothetical protein [Clostridiaceae bacterium]